jgi:hypothetical protein
LRRKRPVHRRGLGATSRARMIFSEGLASRGYMAGTKRYVIVALMLYAIVALLRDNLPRLIPGFCTIAILAPVVTPCRAQANNVYIAQIAAGSANGSSCSSAYAVNYFNSPANWTSGTPTGEQIGPGTTVHLCGVFSVPAGASNFLEFQGNGAKGKPVTLLFGPGAVLSSPYWSGPAINLRGKSYVTVESQKSGGRWEMCCQSGNPGDGRDRSKFDLLKSIYRRIPSGQRRREYLWD